MKNKKNSLKSNNSSFLNSLLDSECSNSSKLTQQLLSYYKDKSVKLEKKFEELLEVLDKTKSSCDLSNELQTELALRNEEVFKLQGIISDLQVHLFREKELNLKLSVENDQLRIEEYRNKKKINLLLMASGTCEKKFFHLTTETLQEKLAPFELSQNFEKLKGAKLKEFTELKNLKEDNDPQTILLNNQCLAFQLENHIKISKEQIDMLLREKEISEEERKIERQRLQKENDLMAEKLKKSQELLCDTTKKLIKVQQAYENEKSFWMEEKDKYLRIVNVLRERLGEDVPDVISNCINTVSSRNMLCNEGEISKSKLLEKEKTAVKHQEHILALEAEVSRLRERAKICRNLFKEKTEKMAAQVAYLKSKYEDLDRRRLLEAEGFRTDIRMLKDRVKELEKKLTKMSKEVQTSEQRQLLVSARNTLNRAKQLEKELAYMKSKISILEPNANFCS